jgi:tol-pal system protein YbgF
MRRLHHLSLTGCLAAALAAAGCVSPQDIEGLQSQLSEIQRQMLQAQRQAPSKQEVEDLGTSVGQQMGSLLKTEADMQVKLQELSSQIDELQAKLEDTNYRLAQLSQQIAATNQELKAFRSQPTAVAPSPETFPGGDPAATPPPQQPVRPSGPAADPQSLYNSAYNDYLRGKYDLALQGFEEYLKNFPGTDLADNATYWIGECYYRQKRYRQAVDQFEGVLSRYPRSDKSAGALLKKGYSLIELGDRSQGVTQLRQVVRQYPTSDEANLARQRLRELGVDAG